MDWSSRVGQEVTVKVTKVENEGKRISLSMKELEKDPWEGLAQRIPPGTAFTKTVARHAEFGLFIEIEPGIDGLVHVSQLPPGIDLKDPSVAAGQEVSGWVREIDEEHRRLSLSLREVSTSDPWEGLAEKMPEGSVVAGQVENVAPFGVFVRLEIGLTGLIPNSETGLPHGTPASKLFTPGQKVEVKVIGLDAQRRRISLSATGALAEAERGEIRKYREESARREKSQGEGPGADTGGPRLAKVTAGGVGGMAGFRRRVPAGAGKVRLPCRTTSSRSSSSWRWRRSSSPAASSGTSRASSASRRSWGR